MDENSFKVEYHSGIPVYRQIINIVTTAILNEELKAGDKLPAIRSLANALNINPNTVAKAYRELELTNAIESSGRNGSVILATKDSLNDVSSTIKENKLLEIRQRVLAEAKAYAISEEELIKLFQKGEKGE